MTEQNLLFGDPPCAQDVQLRLHILQDFVTNLGVALVYLLFSHEWSIDFGSTPFSHEWSIDFGSTPFLMSEVSTSIVPHV